MITFLAIVLAGISLSWVVMYFRKRGETQQENNVDEDAEIFICYDFSFHDELLSDAADIDVDETGKIVVSDGSKSYSFFAESIDDVCDQ